MAPAMDGGDFRSSTMAAPIADGDGRVKAPLFEVDDLPKVFKSHVFPGF